jgi:hypothetical protein
MTYAHELVQWFHKNMASGQALGVESTFTAPSLPHGIHFVMKSLVQSLESE